MNLPFSSSGKGPVGPGSAFDARPIVAVRRKDQSAWWFAGGAIVAAVLLFTALEARRRGADQAASSTPTTSLAMPEAIPDLVIPATPADRALTRTDGAAWLQPTDRRQSDRAVVPQQANPAPHGGYTPQPYVDNSAYQPPPPPPVMLSGQEAAPGPTTLGAPPLAPFGTGGATGRIRAGRLENPAATVVQGTLINAVLETALDSSRPGQTRAVVTRDVYGFDGARILVPRGTRLYGVYEADVAQGQKRAQIRWTRLLRPDGVSVALDSPAADPLGRAGVEGKVNSHFLQRLGNALIGTASNISSTLLTSRISSSSPVVVAVPGAAQTATQSVVPSSGQIAPTLTVRQGTRITVFVQHDLDFSSVGEAL